MGGLLLKKDKPGKPKYDAKIAPLSDYEEVPIPTYQFTIEVADVTVALFQSCTGIEVKRETQAVVEGGLNAYSYELPGQVSFGHVTFETGMSSSDFFWKWMMDGQLDGWIQPKDFSLVQRRPAPNSYKIVRKWDFFNAYPVKWKISDLSVTNSDKIAIESLEISFDYFEAGKI
jgi:phage tail-like protein